MKANLLFIDFVSQDFVPFIVSDLGDDGRL